LSKYVGGTKKLNLVVDTQVFIYGLSDNYESACVKLLDLIDKGEISICFAQDTFGELIYVLKHWSRKNIDKTSDRLNLLHHFVDLFYNSMSYNTKDIKCPSVSDPTDEMFLKCAIASKADYLISDDEQHGMHSNEEIKKIGVKVVKSNEFIELYNSKKNLSNLKSP
jgi:putative PIN family toxin of toxin-antitoxin system